MLNILGHSATRNSVFAVPRRLWPQVTLRPFVILAVSLLLLLVSFAAQAVTTAEAQKKLSSDLQQAISAPSTLNLNWVNDSANGRLVKVLILSYTTADIDLQDLRQAIVRAGGSVYYKYISINRYLQLLTGLQRLNFGVL
jgi:hypothetical protein